MFNDNFYGMIGHHNYCLF